MKPLEIAVFSTNQNCEGEKPEAPKEQHEPVADQQLLGDYAARQSEDAFAEIVFRHAGFVYSAALRQTQNPTVAEEITQAVFVLLARKAPALRRETVLRGWLFRTVRYAAMDFRKTEARRIRREREAAQWSPRNLGEESESAWEQLSPWIDEALASLSSRDRQVILLRYFEKKSFRHIGETFGGNENSARLRAVRALEKLHGWFHRRGVVLPIGLLSSALLVSSLSAAPPALMASVMGTVTSTHCPAVVTGVIRGILRRIWWRRWPVRLAGMAAAFLLAVMVTELVRTNRVQTGTEPRATAMAIDRAISFGDADGLTGSVHFRNPSEEQLKPVFAAFIRAAVDLRQQVRGSFDAQPVRLQLWLWTAEQLLRGQPRRGDINVFSNRVTDDFFRPYLLVMVKVGRAWKWDYFASLPPDVARERMRILQERTVLCERVTRRIQTGEITTAEEVLVLLKP
jgi:RNA polymerase sigma factor (sigma-70 family)